MTTVVAAAALTGCAGSASRGWAQTADAIEPLPHGGVLLGVRDEDVALEIPVN